MKKTITKISIYCSLFLVLAGAAKAQNADTTAEFKPHGKLWGYAFGDFAYKGNADTLNSTNAAGALPNGGRGAGNNNTSSINQYSKMPANTSMFQFRRVYLGY